MEVSICPYIAKAFNPFVVLSQNLHGHMLHIQGQFIRASGSVRHAVLFQGDVPHFGLSPFFVQFTGKDRNCQYIYC